MRRTLDFIVFIVYVHFLQVYLCHIVLFLIVHFACVF